MDDMELDRRAKTLAFSARITYQEALARTVLMESSTRVGFSENGQARPDDVLHASANILAAKIGVPYWDAVKFVAESTPPPGAAFSEDAGPFSDQQLDARAQSFSKEHNVSYAEALRHVAVLSGTGCAAFREDAEGGVFFSEPYNAGEPAGNAPIIGNWIEIFKAGSHVSDQGQSITFSQADIDDIARNYRPTEREAPLVIGHPETDKPAVGWVDGLMASRDGKLLMRTRQVDARFAEDVKLGRYKKRSAAFYSPEHSSNPTPGRWYLRHVGFLGAAQPAIAGLRDIDI